MNPEIATKEIILQKSLECFLKFGYSKTTMRTIIAETGISKGGIYWHFDNKEELFIAVMDSLFNTDTYQDDKLPDDVSPLTYLTSLMTGMIDFSEQGPQVFKLVIEYLAHAQQQDRVTRFWQQKLAETETAIAHIIQKGIEQGEIKPLDTQMTARTIFVFFDSLAAMKAMAPELDTQAIGQNFIENFIHGIAME